MVCAGAESIPTKIVERTKVHPNKMSRASCSEPKQLKRQVRRNIERFSEDFKFELTTEVLQNLRSQIGTSRWGRTRDELMAFSEQPKSHRSKYPYHQNIY